LRRLRRLQVMEQSGSTPSGSREVILVNSQKEGPLSSITEWSSILMEYKLLQILYLKVWC
jgi:hypothetical protein